MLIQDFVLVLVQVILIITFITVFYFTYVCNLEETAVIEHTKELIHTIVQDFKPLLTDDQKSRIKESLEKSKPHDMKEQDDSVQLKNDSLLVTSAILLLSIFIVGIGVSLILIKIYNLDWVLILRNSLVIVSVVALTEFLFITYIAFNYKTLDPNYVKKAVVDSVYIKVKNTDTISISTPDVGIPTNPFI